MKIVRNSKLLKLLSVFIKIRAITLYPYIIIKDEESIDSKSSLLRHELTHLAQQKELFLIGFYILYVYYWIKGLFIYRSFQQAYSQIPFEREAKANEDKRLYFMYRKKFAWKNYR